jgi:transcriptional regulator with GAF, ATPase, and Fis domain
MERATLLSVEPVLSPDALERLSLSWPPSSTMPAPRPGPGEADASAERARIDEALSRAGWNVVRAARLLRLSRSALRHRMRR